MAEGGGAVPVNFSVIIIIVVILVIDIEDVYGVRWTPSVKVAQVDT